jgi:hypothetical protein
MAAPGTLRDAFDPSGTVGHVVNDAFAQHCWQLCAWLRWHAIRDLCSAELLRRRIREGHIATLRFTLRYR